jgi:hypothetical protein
MWEDPIVAEVHRIREKLAAEHNFDIAAYFASLRERQKALGSRLVSPNKGVTAKANAAQNSAPAQPAS